MQLSLLNSSTLLNPARMFVTGNIGEKDPSTGIIINDYPMNVRDILVDLGISMDGVYREKIFVGNRKSEVAAAKKWLNEY